MRTSQSSRYSLKPTQILLVLFFAAQIACAQTIPTRATADEIDQWLRSGNPRMVAWGAYFAAKTDDKDELPVLASLAENYQPIPHPELDGHGNNIPQTLEQKQRFSSMQAVLDSVIQFHGSVTYQTIVAILHNFPAQALTLFATMPEPERSRQAVALYATRDQTDKPYDWHQIADQQMIHMAAAILALKPPPGFTATLLNETMVTLKISVTDDDQRHDGLYVGPTCGDSFGLVADPGWPQPYTYVVEQLWKNETPAEGVLIPGEPAITTRRARSNSSCSALPGFSSIQRLLLAQQEAGIQPSGVDNGTLSYDTVRYPGPADYFASLSRLIDSHRRSFKTLAGILAAKSFMTPMEAAVAMPTLSVELSDQRQDKTQPLPLPNTSDPRITFETHP